MIYDNVFDRYNITGQAIANFMEPFNNEDTPHYYDSVTVGWFIHGNIELNPWIYDHYNIYELLVNLNMDQPELNIQIKDLIIHKLLNSCMSNIYSSKKNKWYKIDLKIMLDNMDYDMFLTLLICLTVSKTHWRYSEVEGQLKWLVNCIRSIDHKKPLAFMQYISKDMKGFCSMLFNEDSQRDIQICVGVFDFFRNLAENAKLRFNAEHNALIDKFVHKLDKIQQETFIEYTYRR